MNKSNELSLKEAFKQLLDTYPLIKDKFNENKLYVIWEKVMGKMIANRTQSITVKKKVLIIEINSASLRNELSFAKEKIKNIINAEFEENIIDEVRVK